MVSLRSSSSWNLLQVVWYGRSIGSGPALRAVHRITQELGGTWPVSDEPWMMSITSPWMSHMYSICPKNCWMSSSGFSMEFSDHFPAMSDWIFAGAQAEARWRGVAVRLRQLSGGRGGHHREWPYGFSILWMASYKLVNLWKIDA